MLITRCCFLVYIRTTETDLKIKGGQSALILTPFHVSNEDFTFGYQIRSSELPFRVGQRTNIYADLGQYFFVRRKFG